MKKSRFYLLVPLILIALSLTFIPCSTAAAEDDISVSAVSAQISYPESIVFKISAQSKADITRIRLNYTIERQNYAPVVTEIWAEFSPGQDVSAQWAWDMHHTYLPPGAGIEYWWTLETGNSSRLTTPRYQIRFSDDRHPWEKRQSGRIVLHWYEGDDAFADDLLSASTGALQRLSGDAGIKLDRTVNIYIYNGSEDFKNALLDAKEWTGGVAVAEFASILIGIAPADIDWGRGALAHELGHLITRELSYSPYSENLPTWLSEGLAMHAEASKDTFFQSRMQKALISKQLISLRTLSGPFSALTDRAYLSYAESQSVVEYLINTYGTNMMLDLLKALQAGYTIDEALVRTYGFDRDGLETKWLDSLAPSKTSMIFETASGGVAN